MDNTNFNIVNASAGSGKTFVLVQKYLEQIFKTAYMDGFKEMLALTFTNKAAYEIKERILTYLADFSKNRSEIKFISAFRELQKNTGLSDFEIQKKSEFALKKIIQNYSYFDILTLDKLAHGIIRNYAFELDFSYGFEIEVDSTEILEEAVLNIINKIGEDKILTKILTEYAFWKTDENLTGNLYYDLIKIAPLILEENNRKKLKNLESHSLEEFIDAQEKMLLKLNKNLTDIKRISKNVLSILTANNLNKNDFFRGSLYSHFDNLNKLNLGGLYKKTELEENIKNGSLYAKRVLELKKKIIEEIRPVLLKSFLKAKKKVYKIYLLKNILKNWIPLAVLKSIQKEVITIQENENKKLLGTFNEIIAKSIAEDPSLSIYEYWSKYRHFYIDEFQDTSVLQWENLVPLINNALSSMDENSERGSLFLVGDPKQSIYGWRGSNVRQFIHLLDTSHNPFKIKKKISYLTTNYRSADEIIDFNNNFFTFVSSQLLPENNIVFNPENLKQKKTEKGKKGGEVIFSDIPKGDIEKKIEKIILFIKENQNEDSIAILVRTNKQVTLLADALIDKKIDFISSESLFLNTSPDIKFLIELIKLSINKENILSFLSVLNYFYNSFFDKKDYHEFIEENIKKDPNEVLKKITIANKTPFILDEFRLKPLYDAIEYAIYNLEIYDTNFSFFNEFLNIIFEFSQRDNASFIKFIEYWEQNGNKKTLSVIGNKKKIEIITIHKAKGLQFDIVIVPFLNDSLISIDKKVWYPMKKAIDINIEYCRINLSKEYENIAKKRWKKFISKNELESINLLYVSFTRAIKKLYLIIENEENEKNNYASLIKSFPK